MVGITKRKRGGKEYYYLYHDLRKGGRRQRDRYLGTEFPENIEEIKQEFEREIYLEEWTPILKTIYENYKKERENSSDDELEKKNKDFSLRFNYHTQRIEGSKLTLKETIDLIESEISPKEKPMHNIKETEAHQIIFKEMLQYVGDLTIDLVLSWHNELLKDTKPDKAGYIRETNVGIKDSDYVPPPGHIVKRLVEDFFGWYERNKMKLNPVILAALVHLKFVTIHPFRDGNGRISRLMMNFILYKNYYPMHDIESGDKNSYYNALERSQLEQNENIFLRWLVKQYLDNNGK